MGVFLNDVVLDAALDKAATAVVQTLCSAQPTTYAEATSTYKLASVAMAPSDFIKSDGDVSGRKLQVIAKTDVMASASGDATHIALCDGDTLLAVTTCTLVSVQGGAKVDFPSYYLTLPDVVAA